MASILLVEDDISIQTILAKALEQDDHEVTKASTGQEALDILIKRDVPFNLLLSDVNMPEMDGIELAYCTHTLMPETKIVLISGYLKQAPELKGMDSIIEDMVPKPFSMTKIRKTISEVLMSVSPDNYGGCYAIAGDQLSRHRH